MFCPAITVPTLWYCEVCNCTFASAILVPLKSFGEFNFAVQEGYAVRNGKIAEPVRGATLIGKGFDVLSQISMIADDLELAAGMCGAASGWVPTTVGQPTLKIDSILVGGR